MSAPLHRPFPLEAGRPENHGFALCTWCGTQRAPGQTLREAEWILCVDEAWCAARYREQVPAGSPQLRRLGVGR